MQTSEMINETSELDESIEMTAEMAMLISKTVEHAIERTKKDMIKRLTAKPEKVPVPVDDNVPGIDTVTPNSQVERNDPVQGIGKPERLKHKDGWSRRIDDTNRLVCSIEGDDIVIHSCKDHCND